MNDELILRAAAVPDFPALISMWQTCFKDSPENTDNLFTKLQKPENIFVLANEKGPAAMLSVSGLTLASPVRECRAAYIYGVATSPEFQGKGLASTLLNGVDQTLQDRKYACSVLVPASESLFGFYGKRGYETAFNINKPELAAEELQVGEVFPLEKIDAARLIFMRNKSFGDSRLLARWDKGYLEYIVNESEFYGGGAYSMTIVGENVFAVCQKNGDTVLIKEISASTDTLDAALYSIHAHFGAKTYKLYLREDIKNPHKNNLLPFAMIKWYDNEVKAAMEAFGGAPAYIAHVLD